MVSRTTYIADKNHTDDKVWRYRGISAENTNTQVLINLYFRTNPSMDNERVCRGYYQDKNSGVNFNFDLVIHRVDHGTRGSADFFAVCLVYVFSDLIWEAYIDSCEVNGIAPERRKTKAEVEAEFTDAFDVVSYADGITPWLRAWRLIFLKSDGLVIDPVVQFPSFRAVKKNDRFPTIRLDLMEPRFQSDYDDLMRHLS